MNRTGTVSLEVCNVFFFSEVEFLKFRGLHFVPVVWTDLGLLTYSFLILHEGTIYRKISGWRLSCIHLRERGKENIGSMKLWFWKEMLRGLKGQQKNNSWLLKINMKINQSKEDPSIAQSEWNCSWYHYTDSLNRFDWSSRSQKKSLCWHQ